MADKYDNARRRSMRGGAGGLAAGHGYHTGKSFTGIEPETQTRCPICSQRLPNHRTMCPRAAVHMVWDRDSGHGHETEIAA